MGTPYTIHGRMERLEKLVGEFSALLAAAGKTPGPRGDDGAQGPPGESIRGARGADGRDGAPGRDAVGVAGPQGRPGVDGADSIAAEPRVAQIETAIRELNATVEMMRNELAAAQGRVEAVVDQIAGHNKALRQEYHELLMRQAKENVERFRRQRNI